MDEKLKIEKWTLDDGRRAERRVTEQPSAENGQSERVIELHVEDERPLRLQQRVVEKSKPVIFERKIETIDATGSVVEQKVESIEPKVQMQFVEHISAAPKNNVVSALSVEDDCDCHVTKEEMIETIIAAIKASRESAPVVDMPVPSSPVMPAGTLASRLNSLGLADEIGTRVSSTSNTDKILMGVIAVAVGILGYVMFFS